MCSESVIYEYMRCDYLVNDGAGIPFRAVTLTPIPLLPTPRSASGG